MLTVRTKYNLGFQILENNLLHSYLVLHKIVSFSILLSLFLNTISLPCAEVLLFSQYNNIVVFMFCIIIIVCSHILLINITFIFSFDCSLHEVSILIFNNQATGGNLKFH